MPAGATTTTSLSTKPWRALEPARSPATQPPRGNPRFAHCDAVRALALLGVIVCHAGASTYLWRDWWLGRLVQCLFASVEVFFVLSGFLLYRPFIAARLDGRPTPSIADYARRRVLRIVPGYWVALAALALWPGLTGVFGAHWWAFFGFAQNYLTTTYKDGLDVAWSLDVEVGFYLLLPLFALGMARATRGRSPAAMLRVEAAALAGLVVVAVGWRALWPLGVLPSRLALFAVPGYADMFAIGMFFAVASAAAERRQAWTRLTAVVARAPSLCWAGAIAAFSGLATTFYVGPAPKNAPSIDWLHVPASQLPHALWFSTGRFACVAAFAGLAVMPAALGVHARGLPRRILSWGPLTFLGVVSYGVYLWHNPLLDWIAPRLGRHPGLYIFGNVGLTLILVTLAISVPLAVASYYLVELPFLRRKEASWRAWLPLGRRAVGVPVAEKG